MREYFGGIIILTYPNLHANLQIRPLKRGRLNDVIFFPGLSGTRGGGTATLTAVQTLHTAHHTPGLSIKLVLSLIYFLVVHR